MDERFYELLAEIAERLDHHWTVKQMYEKVGLSETQFRDLFEKVTRKSPTQYLREARLQRARHLLETTREHIDQIGLQVGMPDPSHFSRSFKLRFDLPPKKYRQQFHEKRLAEILVGQKPAI